jgi:hypothetical protein
MACGRITHAAGAPAAARRDHGRRPVMLDLTQRFEQIWYGNRAASKDDVQCVTAHLETLGCLHAGERAM